MTKLDEILEDIRAFWRARSKSTRGFSIGLFLGAVILVLGFWQTLFLLLCGGIGVFLSAKEGLTKDIVAHVEHIISERHSRTRW